MNRKRGETKGRQRGKGERKKQEENVGRSREKGDDYCYSP